MRLWHLYVLWFVLLVVTFTFLAANEPAKLPETVQELQEAL